MNFPFFDTASLNHAFADDALQLRPQHTNRSSIGIDRFQLLKRIFDLTAAIILLPAAIAVGAILLVLNVFFNHGPLFYTQKRMGYKTRPFNAIKFRTMLPAPAVARGAYDPLEVDRITPLGNFLRRSRIDELPQVINVLRGEMSMIGPRPDFYDHAEDYLKTVPGYRARHAVLPGISGFAQTEVGYAANKDAVAAKVRADLFYIRNRRLRFEAWIVWRTLQTVFGRKGS